MRNRKPATTATCRHSAFELPRSVISSTAVSDTVSPGAKPGEAANFLGRAPAPTKNKHPSGSGVMECWMLG
jgi:hypothetical protein